MPATVRPRGLTVAAAGLLALAWPASPARAVDVIDGSCPVTGVRNSGRGLSVAVVGLYVAATSTKARVVGTFATCTVTYGDGQTTTFGVALPLPAASTAIVLDAAGPVVRACPVVGALLADGRVLTATPACAVF